MKICHRIIFYKRIFLTFVRQMSLSHSLCFRRLAAQLTLENNEAKKVSSSLSTTMVQWSQQTDSGRESIQRILTVNTQNNSHERDPDQWLPQELNSSQAGISWNHHLKIQMLIFESLGQEEWSDTTFSKST